MSNSAVLELGSVFTSQSLSWDSRQWCVCTRCECFSDGCANVTGSRGLMHKSMTAKAQKAEADANICTICFDRVVSPPLSLHLPIFAPEYYTSREGPLSCSRTRALSAIKSCVADYKVGISQKLHVTEMHDTQECDKRIVTCLHKTCTPCMDLVKENAALIDMWECCPFCRNEIKSFVGLHAKQGANATVNPSSPLGYAGPRQQVSLSVVHRNVYIPAQMQNGSKITEPLAAGAFESGPAGADLYIYFCPDSWYDDELKQEFSVVEQRFRVCEL